MAALEIDAEMWQRGVICYVWIDEYNGIDAVVRRTDSCYRVEIRHGAIYRFKMRRVCLIYLDGIVHDVAKSIFQL